MITFFALGLGLWFFYDGRIGFPHKNERFLARQQFKAEQVSEWEAYAKSRGWPKRVPDRLYKQADIVVQYVLGGLSCLGSGAALWLLLKSRKSNIYSDAEAYYDENGRKVPFAAIVSIDKNKWDSKGIAILSYSDGKKTRKSVIDDYKYEGAEKILEQAEVILLERGK